MQSLITTTENPLRQDSVYREASKIGPKASETEWKVTRFDPPHIQVHECRESDFEATLTMRVEEAGKQVSMKARLITPPNTACCPNFVR